MKRKGVKLTLHEAQVLLMAPKDAGGAIVQWSEARSGHSGALLAASMMFAVSTLGHDLVVRGEWKDPGEEQIFLKPPYGKGNLARLCLTRRHPGDLHWHIFEGMGLGESEEVRVPVPYDVGPETELGQLFEKVFVPALEIGNLIHRGRWLA